MLALPDRVGATGIEPDGSARRRVRRYLSEPRQRAGFATNWNKAYRAAGPSVRRRFNQVIFQKLYVDEEGNVTSDLQEPVKLLLGKGDNTNSSGAKLYGSTRPVPRSEAGGVLSAALSIGQVYPTTKSPWVTRVQTPTNTKPVSIPNKTSTPNTQPHGKRDTKLPKTNNTNKTQQNPPTNNQNPNIKHPTPKIYKGQGQYVLPGTPLRAWVVLLVWWGGVCLFFWAKGGVPRRSSDTTLMRRVRS